MNEETIQNCLDQGILISPDLIDENFEEKFNLSSVSTTFTVLSKEVLKLQHKDINQALFEKSRVLFEKNKDNGIYKKFISIITETGIDNDTTQDRHSAIDIKINYKSTKKPTNFTDFVKLYNQRYIDISKILKQRQELEKLTSISRVYRMEGNEPVSMIGMVVSKAITKNNNIIMEIEDRTGKISVLVNQNKNNLYNEALEISPDEVIGVVGASGKGIVFANEIIWPDIPLDKEIKKSQIEEYAVFIGDIHIGSKTFIKKDFLKFLSWISGKLGSNKQKEIAKKIKYLFIIGDLVDGIGIYPGQAEDLNILDIQEQYSELADLLKLVPKTINIVICGGNHDAVRIEEPQPELDREYAESIYALENVTVVSNPSLITIGKRGAFPGFDILLYHGYSFIYYADAIEAIRQKGGLERTDLICNYLLKRRHLAPTHGSTVFSPTYGFDPLVISTVPDLFVTGHVHRTTISKYKGVLCFNCSCWMAQTDFQEKVGLKPQPSKAILFNLQTRNTKILSFGEE